VITFLYLILHGITALRARFDILPVLCIFAGLGGFGLYAYFGLNLIEYPEGWDKASGGIVGGVSVGDAAVPDELVYMAAKGQRVDMPAAVVLHDSEINAFLATHVRFKAGGDSPYGQIVCKSVKLALAPDRIVLYQTASFAEREVILSYHIAVIPSADGYEFALLRVDAGQAALPKSAAAYLWKDLYGQVRELANHVKLLNYYHVEKFGRGSLDLAAIRTRPDPAP
jgi:hypothetical protein